MGLGESLNRKHCRAGAELGLGVRRLAWRWEVAWRAGARAKNCVSRAGCLGRRGAPGKRRRELPPCIGDEVTSPLGTRSCGQGEMEGMPCHIRAAHWLRPCSELEAKTEFLPKRNPFSCLKHNKKISKIFFSRG